MTYHSLICLVVIRIKWKAGKRESFSQFFEIAISMGQRWVWSNQSWKEEAEGSHGILENPSQLTSKRHSASCCFSFSLTDTWTLLVPLLRAKKIQLTYSELQLTLWGLTCKVRKCKKCSSEIKVRPVSDHDGNPCAGGNEVFQEFPGSGRLCQTLKLSRWFLAQMST